MMIRRFFGLFNEERGTNAGVEHCFCCTRTVNHSMTMRSTLSFGSAEFDNDLQDNFRLFMELVNCS